VNEESVSRGTRAEQDIVGGNPLQRRGDGRAAVLAGGGRAAADFGAERRLGVGGTAPGASPSPSSSLGRRSRGGGGVAEAVDDEVVAATDGGVVWGFSGGRL
jgi:hypothetical protein